MDRKTRWEKLSEKLKPLYMYQTRVHLKKFPHVRIPEDEFERAFDKVASITAGNADFIRPDTWAVALGTFTDVIVRLKLKGAEWPEQ